MKVIVKEDVKQADIKYPCLMQAQSGSVVVLFSSFGKGTVIKHPHDKTGFHYEFWDSTQFTPFTGTVELSNDH